MNIVRIAIEIFGFLFGADGFWRRLLFPERDESEEDASQRVRQFLYILRPSLAAMPFFLVWWTLTRAPRAAMNTLIDLDLTQTVLGTIVGGIQQIFDWCYLVLRGINDWAYNTFSPIHFLFSSELIFNLSAIGIYIGCYHITKKLLDKILVHVGESLLNAHPTIKKGMRNIYVANLATGKEMLSPKWERVKRGLSWIITANFLIVYVLNVLTGFATSPLWDFIPINLITFIGFFSLMEVYHFLGLGDELQNRCKSAAELNLVKLLTDYKRYAEEQTLSMDPQYRNSGELADNEHQQPSSAYERAEDPKIVFLYQYLQERNQTECMDMAVQLLEGSNVFYASPFYKDVDGCIFFLIFMSLLRQEKGLILTEDSEALDKLAEWLSNGVDTLSGLGKLWNVAVLQDAGENIDVGILPFQACPELLLNGLDGFLEQVSFVVILESSNMLIGGQELVLSLADRISAKTKGCTWLLCDWNAESMLDLFSHLLKIDLTYVSATPAGAKEAAVSYWDTESEPDYIWPMAKRFLGLETGLATVAEKNEVPCVNWYGVDCMPVADISWIIAQYSQVHSSQLGRTGHQDDLDYLPTQLQYRVSAIPCNAVSENFLIVEDSCCNLYETARQYVTRGRKKVYVHVLSPNYLLRDFMKSRAKEMENDPKYLAQLVPEYVNSTRNAYLHLVRRLLVEEVSETDIYTQLNRCEEPPEFVKHPIAEFHVKDAIKIMVKTLLGISINVNSDIQTQAHAVFSEEEARMVQEPWCHIIGKDVHRAFLKYFRQARYIDETERIRSISHLMLAGHLELKYLPGQFITLNGKYYQVERLLDSKSEMLLSLTRASDQLRGRYFYRQIRTYEVDGSSETMEGTPVFSKYGVSLTRLYLDFTAETIGYITMEKGWNKCTDAGKHPYQGSLRCYFKKQALRVDLPENQVEREDFLYFAAIVHDMFYTFFPQYCYLLSVAIAWEEKEQEFYPQYCGVLSRLTFLQEKRAECVEGQAETKMPSKNARSLYIFEDSYEDMGLLRSIERHFPRILQIVAEYVKWAEQKDDYYFS